MHGELSTQWAIAAILSGLLFLLFDAARFFFVQAGPLRLRRWTGESHGDRAAHQTIQYFSVISVVLVQLSLIGGLTATTLAFQQHGTNLVRGAAYAALIWIGLALLCKYVMAALPESVSDAVLRTVLPLSPFFYYLLWPILFPLRRLIESQSRKRDEADEDEDVTDEEVQAFIDVGEKEGILEGAEGELIQSIVDFGDRIAHELMTPRIDMLAVDVSVSLSDLSRIFSESKYSRIPLYEQSVDRIIGIVHIKDLFDAVLRNEPRPVKELARPPLFVSATKKVSDLLKEFQLEHLQIAIVVDEYGGTAGLITIEDVIEEIVGEIADEHEDEEESLVSLGDSTWLVNGLVRVEKLDDLFDVSVQSDDYETVAGLIFTSMGRVPKVGEKVSKRGLIFEVERADRKRIYRVRVSPDSDYVHDSDQEDN